MLARVFASVSEPRMEAVQAIEQSEGVLDGRARQAQRREPRNLGRLFDDWVGMPPKRFARIVGCKRLCGASATSPGLDLARLAAETGFADQAHLTQEVHALSGLSPQVLASKMSDSFKK